MTHPFAEAVVASVLVVAVGASAALVLPAKVAPRPSDAARVAVLERQLAAVAAEQKILLAQIKAATRERKRR